MEKYHDKYRIPSARLPNWDYRRHAAYFITICTQNREYYFGDIAVSGDMASADNVSADNPPPSPTPHIHLSPIGIIADILWHEIKNHTTGVELGAFIVMPNHIHGILILTGDGAGNDDAEKNGNADGNGNAVETLHATSLPSPPSPPSPPLPPSQYQRISPKPGSVSTIIRSYKSAVSRHAHRLGYQFEWQPRFYDIIIRDDASFRKISDYIIHNPAKWIDDKFYNESDK